MTNDSLLIRIRRFFHLPENEPEIAWTKTSAASMSAQVMIQPDFTCSSRRR